MWYNTHHNLLLLLLLLLLLYNHNLLHGLLLGRVPLLLLGIADGNSGLRLGVLRLLGGVPLLGRRASSAVSLRVRWLRLWVRHGVPLLRLLRWIPLLLPLLLLMGVSCWWLALMGVSCWWLALRHCFFYKIKQLKEL